MDEREGADAEVASVLDQTESDQHSPTPPSGDVETVAREVLSGHWGRGNRRRQRLEAAGFDADEVNVAVNNILKGL